MAFWDKFLEEEGEKEASELQATTETHIPIEAIPEQNEILLVENIEIEKKAQISDFVGYDNIDFSELANTSDFKRLIYRAITGLTWRRTNKGLEMSLKSKLKKLNERKQKGAEKS